MARVAFIGLGVMGYPMAGHLAAHGHQLVVYNRSPAKAERWQQQHPGRIAASPAVAAVEVGIVCLCVGNDGGGVGGADPRHFAAQPGVAAVARD